MLIIARVDLEEAQRFRVVTWDIGYSDELFFPAPLQVVQLVHFESLQLNLIELLLVLFVKFHGGVRVLFDSHTHVRVSHFDQLDGFEQLIFSEILELKLQHEIDIHVSAYELIKRKLSAFKNGAHSSYQTPLRSRKNVQ